MRYLVTGGCGYIGSCLAARLLVDGHDVDIIDWMNEGSKRNSYTLAKMGAKIYTADFAEALDLLSEYQYDAVFHFAAFIEVEESVTEACSYYFNNTFKTLMLAEWCAENGVEHFIFSSTAAVYKSQSKLLKEDDKCEPINPYGLSKFMAEQGLQIMQKDGMKIVCMRYFNVAGADNIEFLGEDRKKETHLIPLALESKRHEDKMDVFGSDYSTKDGTCIRDYIDVNDLVDAHIAALDWYDSPFEIFNLGSGQGYSVLEVLNEIGVDYEFKDRREGDPDFLAADIGKARKLLKWEPKQSLSSMINSAREYEEFKHGC